MAIKFLNTVAVDENVLFVDTVNDRVGIGTDIPEGNLEISDSTQATGATLSITNAHIGSWVTGDKIGSIDFRIDDTSTTQPVRAKIHAEGKTTGTYPSSSQLVFSTANVNTLYERMRIDSAGNVGIGTSTPSNTLQVGDGTEDSAIAVYFSDGSYTRINGYGLYMSRTASYIRPTATTTKTLYIGAPSNIWNAISNNANTHYFITGTNEHMRINSAGNVGIGTTSPASKLSVGGNVITTKKPTVVIADEVAGGSLVIRGLSPILSFDRTGANPQNKILMDTAGLEFKTGTLDAEGDVDFKINPNGDLQLSKGAKISNQENTDIDSAAAEVVAQVSTTYTAAFFDFVIKKTTNVRSGTVYACHDGTNVEFTETSTNDLGDTSDVTLSVDISGTNMRLLATVTSDDWSVKSLIRAI